MFSTSIGTEPALTQVVGKPGKTHVHLTPEMLTQISDQLIVHDIAEVDIDPETFDIPNDKGPKWKKNSLDEIEFISETEPR